MEDLLSSAHTWFLESQTQFPGGELRIRLAEGIKAKATAPLEISDVNLGSFYAIQVGANSRVAEILFESTIAIFSFDESFDDDRDKTLKFGEPGNNTLTRVEQSTFQDYVRSSTTAFDIHDGPLMAWFVWTEDQLTFVLSDCEPIVRLLPDAPHLNRDRTSTWAAE